MYIYNLQKLQDYKAQILHSQEVLDISPIFSPIEKIRINICYKFLYKMVVYKINQMQVATKNATNLTVKNYIRL